MVEQNLPSWYPVAKLLRLAFIVVALISLHYSVANAADHAVCAENFIGRHLTTSECNALMDIYDSADGPNWKTSQGYSIWPVGPRCDNPQITCSNDPYGQRHVLTLDLTAVGMDGTLPGAAFSDLPQLYWIKLNNNPMLRGLIPVQLAELPALRYLDLWMDDFTGSIPEDLLGDQVSVTPDANHAKVEVRLSNNNLSGQLPLSLGRDDISQLLVANNPYLDGPIPHTYIQQTQLTTFVFLGTQICVPQDQAMQTWVDNYSPYKPLPCDELPPPELPPPAPGSITASQGTSSIKIAIGWDASIGADYYDLERRGGVNPTVWSELATPSGENYSDRSAYPWSVYHYRVRACTSNGQCSPYAETVEAGYKADTQAHWFPAMFLLLDPTAAFPGPA